jgi:hypothetical protein
MCVNSLSSHGRNFLKGQEGDAINLLLLAAAPRT